MATEKKMTKRDYYNALLALDSVKADEGMTAFITHEIELLDKKNSAEKKPTATQKANVGIKETIVASMEAGKRYTVTELLKALGNEELTNQKVSSLLRQLVADGSVVKTEDKRKSYFSLA